MEKYIESARHYVSVLGPGLKSCCENLHLKVDSLDFMWWDKVPGRIFYYSESGTFSVYRERRPRKHPWDLELIMKGEKL